MVVEPITGTCDVKSRGESIDTDTAELTPRWRWVSSNCVHDSGSFGRQVDGKHKVRGLHENSWSGVLAQEEGRHIIRTHDFVSLARISANWLHHGPLTR